VDDRNTLIMT